MVTSATPANLSDFKRENYLSRAPHVSEALARDLGSVSPSLGDRG